MNSQLQEILGLLIQVVLIPTIPLIGLWIRAWIQKQIEKLQVEIDVQELEKLNFYLGELENLVATVVISLEETLVVELKRTENWNQETMIQVYDLAKVRVLSALKEEGLRILEKGLVDYEKYIEDLIERLNEELNGEPEVPDEEIPAVEEIV